MSWIHSLCWGLLLLNGLNSSEDISTSSNYTDVTTAAPPTNVTTTAPPTDVTTAPPTNVTTAASPTNVTTAAPPTDVTTAPPTNVTTAAPPTDVITAAPPTEVTTAAPPTEVTTAAPPTVNCTSLAVDILHITPLNDSYLYIGSTATVRVSISLPVGVIERLKILLTRNVENADFHPKESYHRGNMKYTYSTFGWPKYINTSYQRLNGLWYEFYNIATPYSNNTDNRLFSEFYVSLHNAKGLQDGQNISMHALVSYWLNGMNMIDCPLQHLNFTTRTELLKMNKTASFAMVTPKTSELLSGLNQPTKLTFKAWIPDYNPMIKVLLQRNTDSLWITYLRVSSIGSSFWTTGSDIRFLKVSGCTADTSLSLEFPSHWVNKDYYKFSNITDFDQIGFEAEILMTELAGVDSEQKIKISILFNDAEVWNSTVSFKVNSTGANTLSLVKMSITDDLVHGPIVSPSNIPLKLVIETPPNIAETLDIRLWIGKLSRTREPAAIIKNVFFHSADSSIRCYDLKTSYNNTENSSVIIHLKYANSATGNIASMINITFEVDIVPEKMNFTDSYVVFVVVGNMTSDFKISMKLPEIWNDRHNTLIGQFYKLLDGDNNTCVGLPIKGDFPPLFWTRVHTAWFKINASPFEMTMAGRGVSCHRNVYNVSQVSSVIATLESSSTTICRLETIFSNNESLNDEDIAALVDSKVSRNKENVVNVATLLFGDYLMERYEEPILGNEEITLTEMDVF